MQQQPIITQEQLEQVIIGIKTSPQSDFYGIHIELDNLIDELYKVKGIIARLDRAMHGDYIAAQPLGQPESQSTLKPIKETN